MINNFYNSISNSGSVDKAELIEHIKAAIAAKSSGSNNGRSKSSNGQGKDSKNASGNEGTPSPHSLDLSKSKNEASGSGGSNNGGVPPRLVTPQGGNSVGSQNL